MSSPFSVLLSMLSRCCYTFCMDCALCHAAAAPDSKEYAFEMATSTIRFGPGCTSEVGYDLANLGATNVMLVTDSNLLNLAPVKTAVKSLERAKVKFTVYSDVRVEPTDTSMKASPAAVQYPSPLVHDVTVSR